MEGNFMKRGGLGSAGASLFLTGHTDNAFDAMLGMTDDSCRLDELEEEVRILKLLMKSFIISELS